MWLIFVAISAYLVNKISSYDGIQKFAKILVVVVVSGIPLASISAFHVQKLLFNPKSQSVTYGSSISDQNFTFVQKLNIYYILVDVYARQDTLKETLNYDNESFLKNLEDLRFFISRQAHSNYHFTGASLSATMTMTYQVKNSKNEISYGQMHESLKRCNNVRNILKKNGYTIVNIPAHWHQIDCCGL